MPHNTIARELAELGKSDMRPCRGSLFIRSGCAMWRP